MWRAVHIWTGAKVPWMAPSLPFARRLHWEALCAWNAHLRALGGPAAEADRSLATRTIIIDEGAPPCADLIALADSPRAHPFAIAAAQLRPDPALAGRTFERLDLCRLPWEWRGASASVFGRAAVDRALSLCLGALTAWDTELHRRARARGTPIPTIYKSGVRYEREPFPREEFLDSVELRRRGVFDCEDGASDRTGELRASAVPARTVFRNRPVERDGRKITLYHIMVNNSKTLEDPSRALGMSG